MNNQIWHNRRCSKSRQTLALLQERGIDVEIVEYLQQPPSSEQLLQVCELLDMAPQQLCRRGEARYKELGLNTEDERSAEQWAELMVANPILIERPVVVVNQRAALGRPPENVLELLG